MIYDRINHAFLYCGLGEGFALGLGFLARYDDEKSEPRITLDGNCVFALVQKYETRVAHDCHFEAHREYADIQFIVRGEETIYISPIDRLAEVKPYSSNDDAALYTGTDDMPIRLRAGDFCIVFPQEGHKPGCQWNAPCRVEKIVVKVKVRSDRQR